MTSETKPDQSTGTTSHATLVRRHLRFGWWTLAIFSTLGVALELLHGLKLPLYLDVSNGSRRLMWTLSHAHGTLLSLMHIAFASTMARVAEHESWGPGLASRSLQAASILIPGGFFAGGMFIHGGDPGLGVILVAPGGVALVVGLFLIARYVSGAES